MNLFRRFRSTVLARLRAWLQRLRPAAAGVAPPGPLQLASLPMEPERRRRLRLRKLP